MDYPTNYPCPTWQYSQAMTAYARRSAFDCGWTRQRRIFDEHSSSVELSFIMDTVLYSQWQVWVTENAYNWFNIELDQVGGVKQTYSIRFITPTQYSYESFDVVNVSVQGEFETYA